MVIKINSKLTVVQLVALNAFAIIVAVVSSLLEGNFLLVLLMAVLILNLAWYVLIFKRKRVIEIEVNQVNRELLLTYNRAGVKKLLDLDKTVLKFEEKNHINDDIRMVLAIYYQNELLEQIKPGISGFSRDDLQILVDHINHGVPKAQSKTGSSHDKSR